MAVDENDFPTQMVAATSAGNIPEVINMGSELAVAFGSQGLMDHDAHAAVINQIGKDQFFKGSLELTTSPEGHAYALPYHGWVQGVSRLQWGRSILDPLKAVVVLLGSSGITSELVILASCRKAY